MKSQWPGIVGKATAMSTDTVPGRLITEKWKGGYDPASVRIIQYGTAMNEQGILYGRRARSAIKDNLENFWEGMRQLGFTQKEVYEDAELAKDQISAQARNEMLAVAEGSGCKFMDLLSYNLYHASIMPDGCTVYFAAGKASKSGVTVFGKNSDKVGGAELVGDRFFRNKEINVVLVSENEDGSRVVGVAAAGATGLKMGMNSKGVVAGTNIGRTQELKEKKLDLTKLRAIDRAMIIREGLRMDTALAATQRAVTMLVESPTATPGNVEFADANEAYIIESSYDRIAVKKVVDAVDSRANRFQVLENLNQKDDISSIARYYRSQELLKAKEGEITVDDLIAISMDHGNGPGPCSICRHDERVEEETSLSAAVMEINKEQPEKSVIHVALGKPCHAWREEDGHISIPMDFKDGDIPEGFLNGDVFKKYYIEEARFE